MKSFSFAALSAASRAPLALRSATSFPFGRSARLLAAAAAALALRAGADPVRIDLADLKGNAFSAPGCTWDSAAMRLSLDGGDYILFDTQWNPANPSISGSFYNVAPGLNVVLRGDASITVSNVVAVTKSKRTDCTNSVIDLAGYDLDLTLCGENRFSVLGETPNIRAAIHVPSASTLAIDGDGFLSAHVYGGAPACIGSNCSEDSGMIVVNDGTIYASHENLDKCRLDTGLTGAAIGSGAGGNAGRIEIHGGSVNAKSANWAAAIGAGANYKGSNNSGYAVPGAGAFDILITGGTVEAVGGEDGGCGLGGGHSYERGSTNGACTASCPIRILGGVVTASAGKPSSHASCAASAIGTSMANAGAAVVIDSAATVCANASRYQESTRSNPVVSGYNPVVKGSLSFTCASRASDGHVFLESPSCGTIKDVHPADAGARAALPWHVFTRGAVLDVLQVSGSDSKGYSYSLPDFAPGSETAAAVGALSGLPVAAFALDGDVARFTYSRVPGAPSAADVAAFSAWFAAFGADVVALARPSVSETSATALPPDPGTPVDNGDGTASFSLTLPAPVPAACFFQLAW